MNEGERDLPKIGAPASRALASIGVTRLDQLTRYTEGDLLGLHGFGPKAWKILRQAMGDAGLSFASQP